MATLPGPLDHPWALAPGHQAVWSETLTLGTTPPPRPPKISNPKATSMHGLLLRRLQGVEAHIKSSRQQA